MRRYSVRGGGASYECFTWSEVLAAVRFLICQGVHPANIRASRSVNSSLVALAREIKRNNDQARSYRP